MKRLEKLEPKRVFEFFETICSIPHGSTDTKKISDYCVSFAKERGLECHQDSHNNVIIIKEASPGYENAAPMILQGHLDMVSVKEPDCLIDLLHDGLSLAVAGDDLYAEGTSLGGDNGIAVAMALALLDSREYAHPRLEVVLTTDEEIGMEGATALDVSPLKAKQLINLDSEEEGILTVSCAGGVTAECVLPVKREKRKGCLYRLSISGLQGGHSGIEIDKERGNAGVLLGRLLYLLAKEIPFSIKSLEGGQKDNAIPRAAFAEVLADPGSWEQLEARVKEFSAVLKNEYKTSDPEALAAVEAVGSREEAVLDEESTGRSILLLLNLPNGVQAMSADIPGLVETSLNLGILMLHETSLSATFAVRSSVESAKDYLVDKLVSLTQFLGGDVGKSGDYPSWEFRKDSPLRSLVAEVYREQCGAEPRIAAIHAGLECGIFSGKIPNLDCISLGPDMSGVHTTSEKLSISSVQRTWRLLLEVLARSRRQ